MNLERNSSEVGAVQRGVVLAAREEAGVSEPMRLFVVTLDWNPEDSSEGDYSDTIWAKDEAEAIRALAEEMSQHNDCSADSDEDRAKFVENAIEKASTYAASCVASDTSAHLRDLMAGPGRVMSETALQDLAAVKDVLAKYGVKVGA